MRKFLITIALGLCILPGARADEGMWLVQCLDRALEKNMKARGLKLGAREIYNEEAGGITDAIVSLGFYCSGSMISEDGLMITNHHCAYGDVSALSTPEHNYLESGFFALSRDQEIPIPGKEFYFLRKVLDVTDEVNAIKKKAADEGKPMGNRKLSSILEKKYSQESGLEAGLQWMWAGTKYYICLYSAYTDIRLVAAPPVQIASFGSDVDNWEWPQHKADFAMYRIYDSDGQPIHPRRHLSISQKGYKEGSFAMVIGYPGRTSRYISSAELNQLINVERPEVNHIRKRQMDIIKRWMEEDPAVRFKYSDAFFSLSNVAELHQGESDCVRRFGVIESRRQEEKGMPEQELLAKLDSEYASISDIERQKAILRETIFRGVPIARAFMRLGSTPPEKQQAVLDAAIKEMDPRVEKELLTLCLQEFLSGVDTTFYRPMHWELVNKFGNNYKAMASWLWSNSCLKDSVVRNLPSDPFFRFVRDLGIHEMNDAEKHVADPSALRRSYVRARYNYLQSRGVAQYPDANSTMRITYGRVCGIKPYDAVYCNWVSTAAGLREKYSATDYDFHYPDAFREVLPPVDFPINFLCDVDITGGNSGSPVMNARGELIGLAFDGNKESLASNYSVVPGYNMCVCVDIRYVLWILRHYAHQDYVLEELGVL